jgi:tetratricopeptide repeat protein 8
MGVAGPELWNNLGLCCFYAGQHDLAISCFDRALNEAQDEVLADVWFNIGQVATAIADVGLALQALKVAISIEPTHAAAHNNIALLELRRNNVSLAAASLDQARRHGPQMYEPYFNSALVGLKKGELQESFTFSAIAKDVYPGHTDTDLLLEQLDSLFGC